MKENNKVNIDARDKSGYTQLMLAAKKGNLQKVQSLVEEGAEINKTLSFWSVTTAIELAITYGHEEVALFLLQSGASLSRYSGLALDAIREKSSAGVLLAIKLGQFLEIYMLKELIEEEMFSVILDPILNDPIEELLKSSPFELETLLKMAVKKQRKDVAEYFMERAKKKY